MVQFDVLIDAKVEKAGFRLFRSEPDDALQPSFSRKGKLSWSGWPDR